MGSWHGLTLWCLNAAVRSGYRSDPRPLRRMEVHLAVDSQDRLVRLRVEAAVARKTIGLLPHDLRSTEHVRWSHHRANRPFSMHVWEWFDRTIILLVEVIDHLRCGTGHEWFRIRCINLPDRSTRLQLLGSFIGIPSKEFLKFRWCSIGPVHTSGCFEAFNSCQTLRHT